jgi:hypothetical protein
MRLIEALSLNLVGALAQKFTRVQITHFCAAVRRTRYLIKITLAIYHLQARFKRENFNIAGSV